MLSSDWWRCGAKGWCRQDGVIRLLYTFQMWPHNSDSSSAPYNFHIHTHSTPISASIFHSFHLGGWVLGCCLIHQSEWSCSVVSCLCDPMDCSLSGSSVHGIFQAIVLEWIANSFSRGSSQPRNQTWVSCIVDRCFTVWAKGSPSHKGSPV